MKINRFIFRLDFDPCYRMIDAPGTVIEIIRTMGGDHWQQLGPTNNVHQIAGNRALTDRPKRETATITAEPTSLTGDVEFEAGVTWEQLCASEYLKVFDQTCDALMSRFEIYKVKRCGARLLATSEKTVPPEFVASYTERFRKQFVPERLLPGLSVSDCAVHLIGGLEHDVQYRFVTGPGDKTDRRKFFGQIALLDSDLSDDVHAYSIDLDLYQLNINFKGTRLARWLKAKDPFLREFHEIAERVSQGSY